MRSALRRLGRTAQFAFGGWGNALIRILRATDTSKPGERRYPQSLPRPPFAWVCLYGRAVLDGSEACLHMRLSAVTAVCRNCQRPDDASVDPQSSHVRRESAEAPPRTSRLRLVFVDIGRHTRWYRCLTCAEIPGPVWIFRSSMVEEQSVLSERRVPATRAPQSAAADRARPASAAVQA